MSEFFEIIGVKPFKFFRFLLSLLLTLALITFVLYQNSVSTKYIVNLAYKTNKLQSLSLNKCKGSNDNRECIREVIENEKISDITTATLVMVKVVGFYMKEKSLIPASDVSSQQKVFLQLQESLNDLLSNINFKNNYLLKSKPFWSFGKDELCLLKIVEKGLMQKVFDKMQAQSSKDRQESYEKYPNNKDLIYTFVKRQEILDKFKSDIELTFPKASLSRCEEKAREAKLDK